MGTSPVVGRDPPCSGTAAPATRAGRHYAPGMVQWEYLTAPLIVHSTKAILDNFGDEGWELVQVVPGPNGQGLVAYLKRPKA